MTSNLVHGDIYSVEFFPSPKGNPDEKYADAMAVIKPPVDISRITRLIETHTLVDVEIDEYATTQSATIIEISYELRDEGMGSTEAKAMELMRSSVKEIIMKLNEIETGNFPKRGQK